MYITDKYYWVRTTDHHQWSIAQYKDGEWLYRGKMVRSNHFISIGDEFTTPKGIKLPL